MKRALITVFTTVIIIGVIGLALNTAFGSQTVTYLQNVRLNNGMYVMKFNFATYLTNLNMSISETSTLALQLPERGFLPVGGVNWWEPLGNDIAVIINYIFLIINVLLYPMRIGSYLTKNALALLGVNMSNDANNGLYWLRELVNWLIQRVAIPYI